MRDPRDSAVLEGDICRSERSNVYPGEVDIVPKALRLPPRRDGAASTGQSKTLAERFVTTLVRALAAWPA